MNASHTFAIKDSDGQKPHWIKALIWALILGGGFFSVYGSVNAITASIGDVPSLYMPWETSIPFFPQLILPYMSIDLLFVWAFFICRNQYELRALAMRIGFAVTISAIGFIIFPLRFGFERPDVSGFNGLLFQMLSLDLPYNQCPSLHISLAMIVWEVFRRRLHGWFKGVVAIWFLLICASTVLVYQHHMIDIYGGIIVGLLAIYLIPFEISQKPTYVAVTRHHRRMARRYAVLAVALITIAAMAGGWAMVLFYPAISFLLVANAYWSGRSNFLQKSQGRIPFVMQILFAPYLLAVCWTWKFYRNKDQAYCEITPGVMLGRRLTQNELEALTQQGVVAVLDVAPEVKTRLPEKSIHYKHIPILDFTAPSDAQLQEALAFIKQYQTNGKVYIHCALGYWRSASIAAALLVDNGKTPKQAIHAIINARPRCKVLGEHNIAPA